MCKAGLARSLARRKCWGAERDERPRVSPDSRRGTGVAEDSGRRSTPATGSGRQDPSSPCPWSGRPWPWSGAGASPPRPWTQPRRRRHLFCSNLERPDSGYFRPRRSCDGARPIDGKGLPLLRAASEDKLHLEAVAINALPRPLILGSAPLVRVSALRALWASQTSRAR